MAVRKWEPSRHPRDPKTGRFVNAPARLKAMGGSWDPATKTWAVPKSQARALGKLLADLKLTPQQAFLDPSVTPDAADAPAKGKKNVDVAKRMRQMGATWNEETRSWTVKESKSADLNRLLRDIGIEPNFRKVGARQVGDRRVEVDEDTLRPPETVEKPEPRKPAEVAQPKPKTPEPQVAPKEVKRIADALETIAERLPEPRENDTGDTDAPTETLTAANGYEVGQRVEVQQLDSQDVSRRIWAPGTVTTISDAGNRLVDVSVQLDNGRPVVERVGPRGGNKRIRVAEEVAPPLSVDIAVEAGRAIRERAQASIADVERERDDIIARLASLQEQIDDVVGRSSRGEMDVDDAFAALRPLRNQRSELEARRDRFVGRTRLLRRNALLDALREERPGFGEARIEAGAIGAAPPEAVEKLNAATDYLPREWVDASTEAGTVSVQIKPGRANHVGGAKRSVITVSAKDDEYLMLHELTHRLQQVVPRMKDLERDFYLRRVRRDNGKLAPLERLRDTQQFSMYGADEKYRGEWTNPYVGKDYATSFDRKLGVEDYVEPREIMTMALEGIFGDRHDVYGGNTAEAAKLRDLAERVRVNMENMTPGKRKREEQRIRSLETRAQLLENGDPELVDFALGMLARL